MDNFTLRDSQVISTGSASSGAGTNAVRANYSAGLVLDNVILQSIFGAEYLRSHRCASLFVARAAGYVDCISVSENTRSGVGPGETKTRLSKYGLTTHLEK